MAGYGVGLTKTNNTSLRRPVTTCGTVRQTHPDSWANDRPARPPVDRWNVDVTLAIWRPKWGVTRLFVQEDFLDWHTINHQSFAPFLWGFYRCDRWSLLIMGQLCKNKKNISMAWPNVAKINIVIFINKFYNCIYHDADILYRFINISHFTGVWWGGIISGPLEDDPL